MVSVKRALKKEKRKEQKLFSGIFAQEKARFKSPIASTTEDTTAPASPLQEKKTETKPAAVTSQQLIDELTSASGEGDEEMDIASLEAEAKELASAIQTEQRAIIEARTAALQEQSTKANTYQEETLTFSLETGKRVA